MNSKKQIVFIESYSTVMTYKIAKLFKKNGYETVLIRLLEQKLSDDKFYSDAYDKVINFNISSTKISLKDSLMNMKTSFNLIKSVFIAFIQISKLKPYTIFGKANPNWPIAFFRIWFRKFPFIYFPYDIHVHWYSSTKIAKKRGISKFEIFSERFCFEHSDGIMHKGSPEELKYLNGRMLGKNIRLPKNQITFHPYCSKEFCVPINKNKLSKDDGELHFVHIVSGGELKKSNYIPFFNFGKNIIKHKIHYHLYISQVLGSGKNEVNEFLKECKKEKYYKYFHIHSPLNPKEIVQEISKYDLGILSSFQSEYVKQELEPKFCTGNKFATYLEAGIPIFCSSNLDFSYKLCKDYRVLPFINSNSEDFQQIVSKLNPKKLEKNIIKARQNFDMDKNFPRLEEFVRNIVNQKNR
ncbi:MAG: hypothetical protein AABW67_02865 [Nanoarchaeota archaeon]